MDTGLRRLHRLHRLHPSEAQERLNSELAADEVDEEARENKDKATDPGAPHLVTQGTYEIEGASLEYESDGVQA
ncbi:hypothetical protein MAP00_007643 [Monascus purpureus]|nr:hypothetical protein MAP00_007643 [Monascus purpureus]